MCNCNSPSRQVLEDTVTVNIQDIKGIPVPVPANHRVYIPENFKVKGSLLVTTSRKTLVMPRILAKKLSAMYPDNFSYNKGG